MVSFSGCREGKGSQLAFDRGASFFPGDAGLPGESGTGASFDLSQPLSLISFRGRPGELDAIQNAVRQLDPIAFGELESGLEELFCVPRHEASLLLPKWSR
jgi:hypothetical protein